MTAAILDDAARALEDPSGEFIAEVARRAGADPECARAVLAAAAAILSEARGGPSDAREPAAAISIAGGVSPAPPAASPPAAAGVPALEALRRRLDSRLGERLITWEAYRDDGAAGFEDAAAVVSEVLDEVIAAERESREIP